MSFTAPRTWTYGETVTEAHLNEQLRDNLNAMWVGTNAGDMDYYTSNTTKARLAGGTVNAGICIRMGTDGTAPEYGGVVTYRQGGSVDTWFYAGTTNFTPTRTILQAGCFNIPKHDPSMGSGTVIFPKSFSKPPLVSITSCQYAGLTLVADNITTTSARLSYNGGDLNLGVNVTWIAIGEA